MSAEKNISFFSKYSKAERSIIFEVPIYTIQINDVDFYQINKDIEELKNSKITLDIKNSIYEDSNFPNTPACNILKQKMLTEVEKTLDKEMVCERIWCILLQKGQTVNYHTHDSNTHLYPLEYWSVSFYTKVPEGSSDFIFYLTFCNKIMHPVYIPAQVGKMMMFNSYLPHMTNRHNSEETRIVVSANFIPKYPSTKPTPDWKDYTDSSII